MGCSANNIDARRAEGVKGISHPKEGIEVTQIEWFIKAMQKAFQKGQGLWAYSLLDALEGLTAEQAAWKPQGREMRSIWEIVNHVSFWKDAIVRSIEGKPRADTSQHEEKGWPPVTDTSEAAWGEAVEHLKSCHEALIEAIRQLKDEQLEEPFSGEEEPLAEHLFGLIAHDGYHTGQILLLRQLQGIGL